MQGASPGFADPPGSLTAMTSDSSHPGEHHERHGRGRPYGRLLLMTALMFISMYV